MRLQVVLPDESTAMPANQLLELARQAEHLGFDTAWLPDHILPPQTYGPTYGGVCEPLISLAAIAAVTTTLRLGTSVLVLPLRDPFVVAKQAATLDRICGGRFVLGVGAGWDRQEFENVGSEYSTRGARTDQAIELLRHLWSSEPDAPTAFYGEAFAFARGVFAPHPTGGRLPLMVGGTSAPALRRAARFADVWQAVGIGPDDFAARRAELRRQTDRPIEAGARTSWTGDDRDLDDVLAEVEHWNAVGADHLAVWFGPYTGFGDRMAAFMERIYARPPSSGRRTNA